MDIVLNNNNIRNKTMQNKGKIMDEYGMMNDHGDFDDKKFMDMGKEEFI